MIQLPANFNIDSRTLAEPLTSGTDVKRTHLLFTSCASILLTVYGLTIHKTPWLEIEVPDGAPNILHGAISVALVYTLVVFVWSATIDLIRWWVSSEIIFLRNYSEALGDIQSTLLGMKRTLANTDPTIQLDESQRINAGKVLAVEGEHLNQFIRRFKTFRRGYAKLKIAQYIRIAALDIGVPIGLGVFALVKIHGALLPFIAAVFGGV